MTRVTWCRIVFILWFCFSFSVEVALPTAAEGQFDRDVIPSEAIANINSTLKSAGADPALLLRPVRLVFIPGILGSKLYASNGDEVWGSQNLADSRLYYDGKTKLVARFFDKPDLPWLFKSFGTSIYGDALINLSDSNDIKRDDVLRFSYDWRQSNVVSSNDLNSFLCQNREKFEGADVLFVAHSMGGLVLKNWFINFYDKGISCDGGADASWLKVKHVYFAGTPHLGAAKALAALFGKYSLFDNWFARAVLSDGIKENGYSFDSFYELLPVQNYATCVGVGGLPTAVAHEAGNAFDDIFSIDFMEKYNLPIVPQLDRAAFRKSRLRDSINTIGARACALARYDFPKLGIQHVTVFEGGNPQDTNAKDTIIAIDPDSGDPRKGVGDGTVSKESADWAGVINDPSLVDYATESHMKIMNTPDYKKKIQGDIHFAFLAALKDLKSKNSRLYDLALGAIKNEHAIVFSPVGNDMATSIAFEINQDIFAKAGLSDEDVLKLSKLQDQTSSANEFSLTLNKYLVKSQIQTPELQLFQEMKIGKDLLDLGYRKDALNAYNPAIDGALDIVEKGGAGLPAQAFDEFVLATGKALNSRGVILQGMGQLQDAANDYQIGNVLGSKRANSNLQSLKRIKGFEMPPLPTTIERLQLPSKLQ